MEDRIKILYVNGGLMDRGGVTSVMMNYYLRFDSNKIKVDFLVHGYGIGERDNEILDRGDNIYRVPPKSKEPIKNYYAISKIIKKGRYDIVHAHADSGNAYILSIAKKYGVPIRISHSHNTNYTISNKYRIWLNDLQKKKIYKYATHRWSCSRIAAEWLYGTTEHTCVIHNAIEVERFLFSNESRRKIRRQYGIDENYVMVMIGRLDYQKNHSFMLDVIKTLGQKIPSLKLLIVGDGKLRGDLEEHAKRLGINEYIIFCGQVQNVNEYYSAADLFVMPSLFEGFPVSVVEAQVSGVPCLLSTAITSEVRVMENVEYLAIDDPAKWCNRMEQLTYERSRMNDSLQKVIDAGYDIKNEAEKIQSKYIEMVNKKYESVVYK